MESGRGATLKNQLVYQELKRQIEEGYFDETHQLPSASQIAEQYGVSRPTATKALQALKRDGIITGFAITKLLNPSIQDQHKTLGLFIPGLGKGEIFEPICARIAELSHQYNFTLVWGSMPADDAEDRDEKLIQAAQRFIDQGVDGIFFQPIERESGSENKNLRIASMFDAASIPLVLLDGDYLPYPERSTHDLVGIDNISAAFRLCDHLIKGGSDRVDFIWQPNTAGTYILRLIGYREALFRAGISPDKRFEHEGNPRDMAFVRRLVESGATDLICINDETAALLMRSLESLHLKVPNDIRIAGFDDVKYAHLARVPLTTMKQPCRDLGDLALRTLIERMENPSLPPRAVTTNATLCVRESSTVPIRK